MSSVKKYAMSCDQPIDIQYALKNYKTMDRFVKLVEKYEKIALLKDLATLKVAVEEKDYKGVRDRIHSIKGSSAYAGAGRISDICYLMQEDFEKEDVESMMSRYPLLIKFILEFRVYHRKIIADHRN